MIGTDRVVSTSRSGLIAGGVSALIWGFSPIYFKAVAAVGSLEVLAHRILWAFLLLIVLLLVTGSLNPMIKLARQPLLLGKLLLTASLLAANWLTFIWAVGQGRIVEVGLGYFIYPLLAAFLGWIVLGERLRLAQRVAMVSALTGVMIQVVTMGHISWIAIVLALTFTLYSLFRKMMPIGAIQGLTVEVLLLSPFALAYLIWLMAIGDPSFGTTDWSISLLLMMAGLITALPLVLYAVSIRHLNLALVGMISYLSPTLNIVIAVWFFGESFGLAEIMTFGLIWLGLMILSGEGWLRRGRGRRLWQDDRLATS